jgi:ABC-type amino acid transport substrate-binding protein
LERCPEEDAILKITKPTAARAFCALLLLLVLPARLYASCTSANSDADVVVAIRDAAPFTSRASNGFDEGFAIDIWTSIEHQLIDDGLMSKSDIILCDNIDDQTRALASGDIDVVISPLTITAERMQSFDFSQQYLQSGLTLAEKSSSAIDFQQATTVILETITQPGVARAILLFIGFNLVLAFLLRAAFRASGEDHAHSGFGQLFDALVEAIVRTVGLRGYGDTFRTRAGRFLEIFMAVMGTVLSATILGVLTSAFVGSIGVNALAPAERLPQMRIGTLSASTAQAFLISEYEALGISRERTVCHAAEAATAQDKCLLYDSWVDAVAALENDQVEAVLGDWVALTYLSRLDRFRNRVSVDSTVYRNEPYGWGVARDRPELRRGIDRAMIEMMRDPRWRKRVEAYLGVGTVAPN